MKTVNLNNCFGCGKDNPIGLHLKNSYIGEKSHIQFEVKTQYCGHPQFKQIERERTPYALTDLSYPPYASFLNSYWQINKSS